MKVIKNIENNFVTKLLILTLLFLSHISMTFAENTTTYRNETFRFELTHLNTWEIDAKNSNSILALRRTSISNPATLSVGVKKFTGNKNAFFDQIKSNPSALLEKVRSRFPDAMLNEHGGTFIGSFPAYYVTSAYTLKNLDSSIPITTRQFFCIREDFIYLITLEYPSRSAATIDSEFLSMMATFNFR